MRGPLDDCMIVGLSHHDQKPDTFIGLHAYIPPFWMMIFRLAFLRNSLHEALCDMSASQRVILLD